MSTYNIALLHYSCPPVVGGVEEVLRQQAAVLHRHFHNVKVFAGAGKQFSPDFLVEINPLLGSRNKYVLHAHRDIIEKNDIDNLHKLSKKIYNYLKTISKDVDVIIAHNVLTLHYNLPLTYALHRFADDNETPLVSWNHDSPFFYENCPEYLHNKPWDILKTSHENIHYVTITDYRRKLFDKLYKTKKRFTVIPNGVDPYVFFKLDPLTIRLIREQNLFKADFLMVQPSRLHPRKNFELSIKVIRALHDRGVHARLLATGAYDPHEPRTVEYYKKLKILSRKLGVEKDILLLAEYKFRSGESYTPDRITTRDLYLIADILFMPSSHEGFGLPLLEAGMIKLPIVCSDIPPFREIGADDVCFFSLRDSPEEIAKKIMDFISSLKTQKFFRGVIRKHAWDNIYETLFLPFLEGVINRK